MIFSNLTDRKEGSAFSGAKQEKSAKDARYARSQKAIQAAFVVVCAAIILLPFVGMIWAPTNSTTENRTLAPVPQLEIDGAPNIDYLSDWGAYFEDHFAFRDLMVTANSQLRSLLGTPSTDSVILGKDGWLFYGGTASNYYQEDWLTERELDNLAFDLSLIQGYCNAHGADFAFMAVPNKNSIYPENMPYYFGEKASTETLEALSAALESHGVNSVNANALLKEAKAQNSDSLLYYKTDTHWNQQGALIACADLMDALGRHGAAEEYSEMAASGEEDHAGDLAKMLYPSVYGSEKAPTYDADLSYVITEGANEIDTDDSAWIETEGEGEGVLYMYRDSFAQNMIPFLADEYSCCYFDWYVPMDYTKVLGRDVTDVVVEKVERNLGDLVANPGVIPAPSVAIKQEALEAAKKDAVTCPADEIARISQEGSMVSIEGTVPQELRGLQELGESEVDSLFLIVETASGFKSYVPFRVTIDEDDLGYRAYLYEEDASDVVGVNVIIAHGGKMRMATADIK